MGQLRRALPSRGWLLLLPLLGCVLVACGTAADPAGQPPTPANGPGSAATPKAGHSPPPLEFDSPHCYTEAKDPTTDQGLSDADCATATQLALTDSRVQQLLNGVSYHWKMVVLWHRDSGGPIGAVVTLELAQPASVDGEWLATIDDCTPDASPPYHSIPYRQAGTNLSEVMVWVDLTRHQMVGVMPAADPTHEWTPVGTPDIVGAATWPSNTCPGD